MTAVRLLLSLGLLGAIVWMLEGAGLWRRLASADFSWFLLAIALGLVANLVSAWRWSVIARRMNLQAPTLPLLLAYARGVALSSILPGATVGGDAYRAVMLQRHGNPLLKAAASVLLDRLSGLWALFALSGTAWLGLLITPDSPLSRLGIQLHLALLGVALLAPYVASSIQANWTFSAGSAPERTLRLLVDTARHALATLGSSLIVQIASIAALWASLMAVAADIPAMYLVAVAAPVFFAAALPISIGGYGTREAALAAYFSLAGLPAEAAVAGALLNGLAITLQGALWSPLFLLGTSRQDKA